MPQYLILLYEDEQSWAEASDEKSAEILAEHGAFGERHRDALRGGSALQPQATATTIRGWNTGTPTVTDGPFAETKEALGGFYLIEAADLDEALAIARDVPTPFGGVEVRPVRVFD
jgi:hypothetical protein